MVSMSHTAEARHPLPVPPWASPSCARCLQRLVRPISRAPRKGGPWVRGPGVAPRAPEVSGSQKEHRTVVRLLRSPLGPERSTEDPGASSGARAKTQRPDGGSEPGPIPQRRPLTGSLGSLGSSARGCLSRDLTFHPRPPAEPGSPSEPTRPALTC